MKKITLFTLLSLFGLSTQAGLFSISCTGANCGLQSTKDLITSIENTVNSKLPDADASTYLKSMADSSVMSSKHTGSDYANDIDLFLFAISLGTGFDVGNKSFSDVVAGDIDGNQVRGVSVQPSLLLGLNLGILDTATLGFLKLSRLKVFMNVGAFDQEISGVNVDANNFGVHFRYKWIESTSIVPGKMLHWTGVDITTGFEVSKLKVNTTQTFSETVTSGALSSQISGPVNVNAEVSTYSIPLEISSGVQLAYFLSTYGGLGADLNFGSAKGSASANSISIGGVAGANLTGSIELGEEESPSAFDLRMFVGLQLNIPFVKLINIQLDKMLTNDVWGVTIKPLTITW